MARTVCAADYTVWRDNLGQSVTPYAAADGDGNGVIDNGDYMVWKVNFGDTPTPSTVVAAASVSDAGEPFFLSPSLPAGTARRSASQPVAEASSSGFLDNRLLLLALRKITGDDPTEEPSDRNRHREPLSRESATETLEIAFSEWD